MISRRVWRHDSRYETILRILIGDIDEYNQAEAARSADYLKKTFNYSLFREVMQEHFSRQQRIIRAE